LILHNWDDTPQDYKQQAVFLNDIEGMLEIEELQLFFIVTGKIAVTARAVTLLTTL
jgi:hypothetical protein